MSNSIREIYLSEIGPRIETGPTRLGKDSCGLFIRGDDCFNFAMALESILTKREDRVSKIDIMTLRNLLQHLQSTNESTQQLVECQTIERIPGLKSMSYIQLKKEVEKRKELLNQMIGSLYPAIVTDEISIIEGRMDELIMCDELN